MFAKLICDHEKQGKAVYYCSEAFSIATSTVKGIISQNQRFYKNKHAQFNKCPIKLKLKKP